MPWKLAVALVQDFSLALSSKSEFSARSESIEAVSPLESFESFFGMFWQCKRCQHGATSGAEHTRVKACCFAPDYVPKPPLGGVPAITMAETPSASNTGGPSTTTPSTSPVSSASPSVSPVDPAAPVSPAQPKQRKEPDFERVEVPPSYIEPSLNFRAVLRRLRDPNPSDDAKKREIMGVHVKFWHAAAADMIRFLGVGRISPIFAN